MRLVLVTPATFRPLEPELIRDRPELRTAEEEDPNIAEHIRSAIEGYETYSGHILCRSTLDLYLDHFPSCRRAIETPAPLVSVDSIKYLDSSGALQALAASAYVVDQASAVVGRVGLTFDGAWPLTCRQENAVIVRLVAGYANAAAIPQSIKDGMFLKIQELYDGIDRSEVYYRIWSANRAVPI